MQAHIHAHKHDYHACKHSYHVLKHSHHKCIHQAYMQAHISCSSMIICWCWLPIYSQTAAATHSAVVLMKVWIWLNFQDASKSIYRMYMHVFLNANTYDIRFCNRSQALLFDFQHKQKPSWPQNHSLHIYCNNIMSVSLQTACVHCTHFTTHQIIFWAPWIFCLM